MSFEQIASSYDGTLDDALAAVGERLRAGEIVSSVTHDRVGAEDSVSLQMSSS